jgi:predicted TIM-barrel fold metal-dependent hydrolase
MTDYKYIDFDSHYYEPDDCFSRHIESKFKQRTIRCDRSSSDGMGRMLIEDERLAFTSVIQNDFVGAPGIMKAFFKGENEDGGAVNLKPICPRDFPYMMHKNPRLQLMDTQSIQACVMLPTLGVTVQHHLSKHAEIEYPTLRAFNRWVEEEWGFGSDKRIYAAACLTLNHLDSAVKELERLIKTGVKLIHLPCGPVNGRSPADPYFDRFWAKVEEAGVLISFHIGETSANEIFSSHWGEPANPPVHRFTALNMFWGIGARTITDQIAAMICHNLFGRFPLLQITIIEFGSNWIRECLATLDKIFILADHKTKWPFGKPSEKPSQIFQKHCSVVPFFEEDIKQLETEIGGQCIINGSDFPHPEGLESPEEMLQEISLLSADKQNDIMYNNGAKLLGLAS